MASQEKQKSHGRNDHSEELTVTVPELEIRSCREL